MLDVDFNVEENSDEIHAKIRKEIAEKKHEVKVIRSGETKIITNTDLVPGDIVYLQTGDKVPADVRIIEAEELKSKILDNSLDNTANKIDLLKSKNRNKSD